MLYRLSAGQAVKLARVPFNILPMQSSARSTAIDDCVRRENAYKSFVAPDKLAECLRPLIDNPWDLIARQMVEETATCKARLRDVIALRNRIAHEADVNPAYGGVELWPIYKDDVDQSISFLAELGTAIAKALS